MKKGMKSILTPILVATFMAMPIAPAMAAATPNHIDYVAFGDSVAAGVRGGNAAPWDPAYEKGSEFGYTDNIANKLEEAGVLNSFNEDYAISGATAAGLAIASNALNYPAPPAYNPAYNLVKNAEIMTLDIGANDLLGDLYKYVATLDDINDATPQAVAPILNNILNGLIPSSIPGSGSAGLEIEANIETILQNILNANPNVKIYVMGYYNPLPVLPASYGVDSAMYYFNQFIIKKAISDVIANNKVASINYVDSMAAMAKNSDKNLVPTDIHPTEAGYRVIAKEFWSQVKLNLRNAK